MELALMGLPTVVAYDMGLMGDMLMRTMQVPSAVLVNLILDAPAMPEFLQWRCTPQEITPVLQAMLEDEEVHAQYQAMLAKFAPAMRHEGQKPAERAAALTLDLAQ
jgi:lipid-A-disaccharide synthase